MGHKVHPTGFRVGVIKDWQSKWYTDAHYAEFVQEDMKLRAAIKSKYREAAISLIEIDRQAKDVTITLHTARPGIVIGRGGQRVDEMRLYLENLIGKRIRLNIQEIRQPELDAYLVARSVAEQIERRIAYRRAMKQTLLRTIQAGAKGIKISCAGRLGNAEIARRQTSHEGQVPLHTLRADIDYGFTEAHTTLGRIGVKVWIYKGEVLPEPRTTEAEERMTGVAAAEGAEAAPTEELEEKPAEVIAEGAEAVPTEQLEEKPVEVVAEGTEAVPTEEIEEKPVEAAPAAEAEKKPAKTRARRGAKAATEGAEAVPPEEIEEKPVEAVPVTEAEKKPAKTTAKKVTAATAAAESEDKPAKPAVRRSKKTTTTAETEAKAVESAVEVTTESTPDITTEEETKDAAA